MGPKKKGKGSKLARMSEEEKIRYLQHRAAIEEEARRRKEQLISTFMKNKLKHEEAFTRLNSAKINQQWRMILRKYKCTELKDDMEALWNSFERTIKLKNKVIDALLSDLEDAEAQYSMMFQTHSETVGKLIGLHDERLGKFFGIYQNDRGKLLQKAATIRSGLEKTGNRRCEHMQTVVFEMNNRYQKDKKSADELTMAQQDELRNQMLTDIEKEEEKRYAQIEKLWQTMQQVLREYNTSMAPMKLHYSTLCERDKNNSAELLKHCDVINKYSDIIGNLKQQLVPKQKEHNEEVKILKRGQASLLQKFQKLRNGVTEENRKAHARLTFMSVTSSSVIEKFSDIVKKGESVLQLNLNCQKYQTQMEKILPSYCKPLTVKSATQDREVKDPSGIEDEGFHKSNEITLTKDIKEESKDILEVEDVDDTDDIDKIVPEPLDKLENFWKQHNEVLLECQALELHHESCLAENRQLKRLLRHYLNTLARPSSVPNLAATRTSRMLTSEIPVPRFIRKRVF